MYSTWIFSIFPLFIIVSSAQNEVPESCNRIALAVSRMKQDPGATPYCSRFLGISTSTLTYTRTVPGPTTTATSYSTTIGTPVTSTRTESATVTQTVAGVPVTSTSTTTTTTPVGTTTATCLATPPVGKRGDKHIAARQANGDDARVSSICSCLGIPTPTSIKIVTQTLPTSTVTVTSTIVSRATITTTVTTTGTVTSTTFATIMVTTTASEVGPEVTTYDPQGLRYKFFASPFNDQDSTTDANPEFFKGLAPLSVGTIENLNFNSDSVGNVQIGGNVLSTAFHAILAQGYFLAREAGTYTFKTYGRTGNLITDDWAFLWHGDVAYGSWTNANKDFEAFGYRPGPAGIQDGQLVLQNVAAGQAVPFTYLWINGRTGATSNMQITTPQGTLVTDTSGWFIGACLDTTFS